MRARRFAIDEEHKSDMPRIITSFLESELATLTDAIPRTIKLYGQINPNTKSGGCHDGRLREPYQPGELFTQNPEPIAYISTRTIPIPAATDLNSIDRD
jgi:hypothetical protein